MAVSNGYKPKAATSQQSNTSQNYNRPAVSPIQQDNADHEYSIEETQGSASQSNLQSNLQQPLRQFKLISVNFKEAALDSPSFRASSNHLDCQVDNIEKWLLALTSSVKKIPKYISQLQTITNSFLEHLVPTFLQDGLIDQEYTVQSLQATASGMLKLWETSMKALTIKTYLIDSLNTKIIKAVRAYREVRSEFDVQQEKYDRYLSIYVATSKTKDAYSVMEDAKQLFQVRKDYIHISLLLVTEISNLSNLIDRALVKVCSDLWKNKRYADNVDLFDLHPDLNNNWNKIQKILAWCDSYSIAVDKLRGDMLTARDQVEESAIHQSMPSNNAADFKISLINAKMLTDINEMSIEKHGYLFMKTYIEKSTKPIWVKRWVFVKGGVFGLLVLSSSQTFVQETDKIGVLLCNVKYAPQEDRKYCFEVKTKNTTIVFQAENLFELKSWLKVFENERNRILQEDDPMYNDLLAVASGRYPPIVTEFASTINTSTDKELTNHKIVNSSGQIITSSKLSHQIQKNERIFKRHIYHQIPQIRPPFMTDTTKSSIIAYSLAATNTLPTALTANIWGSANWGLYYLHEVPPIRDGVNIQQAIADEDTLNIESDEGINYPDYYPYELISLDIQMRALFETAVEPGELCLISYRCIWSPNSRQELSGRCFITNRHVYFYMQSLGFVALTKLPVEHLVAVDSKPKKNHDILKIYNMNGIVKMKLFLDDGRLIKKKLNYFIQNNASDHPKHLHELINNLVRIENQHEIETKNDIKFAFVSKIMGIPISDFSELQKVTQNKNIAENNNVDFINLSNLDDVPELMNTNSFQSLKGIEAKRSYKVDYSDMATLVMENIYNIPPKALFHALLGDHSNILDSYSTFITLESRVKVPWFDLPNNQGMTRRFNSYILQGSKKRGQFQITDKLDGYVEDEYYSFTHEKSSCKMICGSSFSIIYRFVCVRVNGNQTKVSVYSKVNFHSKSLASLIVRPITLSTCRAECKDFDKNLRDVVKRVGTHGTVVKSIYLYGKLSHSSKPYYVEKVEPIVFRPSFLLRLFFKKSTLFILSKFIELIHFIFNLLITMIRGIKLNRLLLIIIAGLCLTNLFFIGKTTTSYWTAKHASTVTKKFLNKSPLMLQRSVYLKDVQDYIQENNEILNPNSICYETFKNKSFIINYNSATSWTQEYGDENTREVAKSFKKSLREIGVKRHELIVRLKMLNDMESELAKAEWKNWLMSEITRCEYIKNNIFNQIIDDDTNNNENQSDINPGIESVLTFCNSCSADLDSVNSLL